MSHERERHLRKSALDPAGLKQSPSAQGTRIFPYTIVGVHELLGPLVGLNEICYVPFPTLCSLERISQIGMNHVPYVGFC